MTELIVKRQEFLNKFLERYPNKCVHVLMGDRVFRLGAHEMGVFPGLVKYVDSIHTVLINGKEIFFPGDDDVFEAIIRCVRCHKGDMTLAPNHLQKAWPEVSQDDINQAINALLEELEFETLVAKEKPKRFRRRSD